MPDQDWKQISAKAQQILWDSIPSEWRIPKDKLPAEDQKDVTGFPAQCGILTKDELAITDGCATEIVKKIAAGEWKAEDVTRAFCKRAAIAQQLVSLLFKLVRSKLTMIKVNCLTVTMFDQAIAQAKKLDEHFAKTGKTVGPLHGLPVSLKGK